MSVFKPTNDNQDLLGLLFPAAVISPKAVAGRDTITSHWKGVLDDRDFDLNLAAAYVRDAYFEFEEFGLKPVFKGER